MSLSIFDIIVQAYTWYYKNGDQNKVDKKLQ